MICDYYSDEDIPTLCSFADHLRKFQDIFTFPEDNSQETCFGDHVKLHPSLKTPEDRTRAVADVVKCLGEELIPGIRNEVLLVKLKNFIISIAWFIFDQIFNFMLLIIQHVVRALQRFNMPIYLFVSYVTFKQHYPVLSSFGTPAFFSLERAAAPYFGIKVC